VFAATRAGLIGGALSDDVDAEVRVDRRDDADQQKAPTAMAPTMMAFNIMMA
jgi:hypothetical protein